MRRHLTLKVVPPGVESGAAWRLIWRRLTLNAALPGAEYINESMGPMGAGLDVKDGTLCPSE